MCLCFKEELRDVREQLAIYEQRLGISLKEEMMANFPSDTTSGRKVTPEHQLPLFLDARGGLLSSILPKTLPVKCKQRRSSLSVSFATHIQDYENMEKPSRPASAVAAPLSSTWNCGGEITACEAISDDEIISTTISRR